jgi:hypothetical protein
VPVVVPPPAGLLSIVRHHLASRAGGVGKGGEAGECRRKKA